MSTTVKGTASIPGSPVKAKTAINKSVVFRSRRGGGERGGGGGGRRRRHWHITLLLIVVVEMVFIGDSDRVSHSHGAPPRPDHPRCLVTHSVTRWPLTVAFCPAVGQVTGHQRALPSQLLTGSILRIYGLHNTLPLPSPHVPSTPSPPLRSRPLKSS